MLIVGCCVCLMLVDGSSLRCVFFVDRCLSAVVLLVAYEWLLLSVGLGVICLVCVDCCCVLFAVLCLLVVVRCKFVVVRRRVFVVVCGCLLVFGVCLLYVVVVVLCVFID